MKLFGSESLSGRGHFACGCGFPFLGEHFACGGGFPFLGGISHAAVDSLSWGHFTCGGESLSWGRAFRMQLWISFPGEHFACGRCEEGKHS